jgi:hypothetical protein
VPAAASIIAIMTIAGYMTNLPVDQKRTVMESRDRAVFCRAFARALLASAAPMLTPRIEPQRRPPGDCTKVTLVKRAMEWAMLSHCHEAHRFRNIHGCAKCPEQLMTSPRFSGREVRRLRR